MKKTVPCSSLDRKGRPCGRRVIPVPGAVPLCHLHIAQQNGNPMNGGATPIEPKEVDIEREWQKLCRSRDENIRVKALEKLEAFKARHKNTQTDLDVEQLTEDEFHDLWGALLVVQAIKKQIRERLYGPEDVPTPAEPPSVGSVGVAIPEDVSDGPDLPGDDDEEAEAEAEDDPDYDEAAEAVAARS